MALYEILPDSLRALDSTTFGNANLRERQDLQRLLRDHIDVIAPGVLVVAEEYGEWEDSRRRIDLLGVDKDANLVVIELKRTEDGGHMELQAIRYAAMVSTMTFEQVVETYTVYLQERKFDSDARENLLRHLDWEEPEEDLFAQEVKIVLASADFSREITSAVLWLNERGIDIKCLRLTPYLDGARTLLDIQQVIPLPEAEEYQVRIRVKAQKERADKSKNSLRHDRRFQFWEQLISRCEGVTQLHANIKPGVYNWIGTGSGVRGLGLNYSLRKHDTAVELYIDRGKDAAHENIAALRYLEENREDIEKRFGQPLEWQELDGARACRIRLLIELGGWRDEPANWPQVQDTMIQQMMQFESALRPYLDRIDKELFAAANPNL